MRWGELMWRMRDRMGSDRIGYGMGGDSSVISHPSSVISHQSSVISHQSSVINRLHGMGWEGRDGMGWDQMGFQAVIWYGFVCLPQLACPIPSYLIPSPPTSITTTTTTTTMGIHVG